MRSCFKSPVAGVRCQATTRLGSLSLCPIGKNECSVLNDDCGHHTEVQWVLSKKLDASVLEGIRKFGSLAARVTQKAPAFLRGPFVFSLISAFIRSLALWLCQSHCHGCTLGCVPKSALTPEFWIRPLRQLCGRLRGSRSAGRLPWRSVRSVQLRTSGCHLA
jgi:hypothetical protein